MVSRQASGETPLLYLGGGDPPLSPVLPLHLSSLRQRMELTNRQLSRKRAEPKPPAIYASRPKEAAPGVPAEVLDDMTDLWIDAWCSDRLANSFRADKPKGSPSSAGWCLLQVRFGVPLGPCMAGRHRVATRAGETAQQANQSILRVRDTEIAKVIQQDKSLGAWMADAARKTKKPATPTKPVGYSATDTSHLHRGLQSSFVQT